MELSQEDSLLIDQYLQNALSDTEKSRVEGRLANEPLLAEAITFRQLIQKGGQSMGRENLKQLLKEADKEMDEGVQLDTKVNHSKIAWYQSKFFKLAAVIIGLTVGVGILITFLPNSTERLYATHYEAFPNLIAPIEKGTEVKDLLTQATQAYERKDYDLAVQQFEQLPNIEADSRIYYALSLLQLNKTNKAIAELADISQQNNNQFQQAAQWYLVLAYLKNEQKQEAKQSLQQILNTANHRYFKKAQLLESDW